jgi:hypothetical protein
VLATTRKLLPLILPLFVLALAATAPAQEEQASGDDATLAPETILLE